MGASAADCFQERQTGFNDALRLEAPDSVPLEMAFGYFLGTDIFRAKDVLGGHLCISGNVPASLLVAGMPDEVRGLAKRPDNLRALIDFTIEYGVYA